MTDHTAIVVRAQLRHVASGEAFIHTETWDPEHRDGVGYMWLEGNNACDCNRTLFHRRAHRVPEFAAWDDLLCGDDAYKLEWLEIDGEKVWP